MTSPGADTQEHAYRVLEYPRICETLASYAASPLGKACANRVRPLDDIEEIRRQLRQSEEMRSFLRHTRLPLSGLRDVATEIRTLVDSSRPGEPDFFYRVVDLLRAGVALRGKFSENSSALPELARLGEAIEDLPELRADIPEWIDPKGGVRDEASPKLAELRTQVRDLRNSLRRQATSMLSDARLRRAFQAEGVAIKHDRYMLPVKAEYRSWVLGPIRDRSQTGSTFYVEPEALTGEGDRLLEVLDKERDEEQRILWQLMRRIIGVRAALERIQEAIAWVDFTYAKASYAEAFGLTAPDVNVDGVLDLKDARHPHLLWLARDGNKSHREIDLEAVRKAVVPISVRVGQPFRILIITGPNTGGKTVALKTVGLSALLALSGIPIAAEEGSRIPMYSGVFADIGDEQSLEQSLSTFSSHLTHVIEILRQGSPGSLILLDELGAGTDPIEGAALGRVLLDTFLKRGWSAVITTHIGSLKEYAYAHEGAENASMEFDQRSLQPTFRLLMGIPGSSKALDIARRLGLDEEIVAAAEEEISRVEEPTREIVSRMERSRRGVEKERRRAERVRRKVQGTAKEYDARLAELEAERAVLREEAQQESEAIVRAAKARLESLLAELGSLPKAHQDTVDRLRQEVDTLLVSTPLGEKREAFARSLKKGVEVFVPKFREKGTVRRIDKGGRRLTVLLSGLAVELSFDDVSWLDGLSE